MTEDLAWATFGGEPRCLYAASTVAFQNAAEDVSTSFKEDIKFFTYMGVGWQRPGPHFPNASIIRNRVDDAMQSCDLSKLGKALHSVQDAVAHAGIHPLGHFLRMRAPDLRAAESATMRNTAMAATAQVLRAFKDKCMKCGCL